MLYFHHHLPLECTVIIWRTDEAMANAGKILSLMMSHIKKTDEGIKKV